ncbi:Fc.00g073800.m01.CDS01 [Cosmosporella sp. VM-42]
MSLPSPEISSVQSVTAAGTVSPPSYTPRPLASPSPAPEDKIALSPVAPTDEKIATTETPKSEQRPIVYEDGPEVVPENQAQDGEKPKYLADEIRNSTMTPPVGEHYVTTTLPPQSPPPPSINQSGGYHAPPSMAIPVPGTTVTPLHLLGDQSDSIDCPFCERHTETTVQTQHSAWTHVGAGALFITTFCGVAAPYMCHWCAHVNHYCQNCGRKVAYKRHGGKEMVALGTPEHLREVSKYPPAPPPPQPQPQPPVTE